MLRRNNMFVEIQIIEKNLAPEERMLFSKLMLSPHGAKGSRVMPRRSGMFVLLLIKT